MPARTRKKPILSEGIGQTFLHSPPSPARTSSVQEATGFSCSSETSIFRTCRDPFARSEALNSTSTFSPKAYIDELGFEVSAAIMAAKIKHNMGKILFLPYLTTMEVIFLVLTRKTA